MFDEIPMRGDTPARRAIRYVRRYTLRELCGDIEVRVARWYAALVITGDEERRCVRGKVQVVRGARCARAICYACATHEVL